MAKKLDCELCETIQSEQNNHTFQFEGNNYINPTQFSIDNSNHYIGCMNNFMDFYFLTIRKNEFKNTSNLIDEQSETLDRKFYDNTAELEVTPISCECNILQRYIRTSGKIHDECVSSLPYECKKSSNKVKIQNADSNADIRSKVCPNRITIGKLQLSFGKLRRIGILAGYEWTTELPSRTCQLVYANPLPYGWIRDQGSLFQMPVCEGTNDSILSCNNRRILVDTFESKSDRYNVATFIGCDQLTDRDPKIFTFYISNVAEFCFDHIIIIGEVNYGILFLDCFGRVFLWEDESELLYPLRDSLEAPRKYKKGQDRLAWIVENGKVYEYFVKG
ncbi:hypothetical protein C1646_753222 [Rhizophagus diaphanus]|nr:hypothetical protein C1646_753222 [Rhizophagus diaphanus] [Rhizophagus sp. MUCL 43196]